MTNPEFSDTFTTLLNSYNTQANFGEEANKRDIVLDEYEKSVLLTQAQDIIVKGYFDKTLNSQGQGFDDSTRRQVDFSSLIKVKELQPYGDNSAAFDPRGIIYNMPKKTIQVQKKNTDSDWDPDGNSVQYRTVETDATDVLFILNEKLIAKTVVIPGTDEHTATIYVDAARDDEGALEVVHSTTPAEDQISLSTFNYRSGENVYKDGSSNPEAGSYVMVRDADVTIPASEPVYNNKGLGKEYVIVPINYKEYDREMSKPFAQPLKKQAWRLFQNLSTGFDVNSELIPKWNIRVAGYLSDDSSTTASIGDIELVYKIRYVKRPRPIILEELPNELVIDGESDYSECELNPILHMDILNKAVELAIATRGGAAAEKGQYPSNNMKHDNN